MNVISVHYKYSNEFSRLNGRLADERGYIKGNESTTESVVRILLLAISSCLFCMKPSRKSYFSRKYCFTFWCPFTETWEIGKRGNKASERITKGMSTFTIFKIQQFSYSYLWGSVHLLTFWECSLSSFYRGIHPGSLNCYYAVILSYLWKGTLDFLSVLVVI